MVFASVFSSALLGMLLRSLLPEHHLSADSKDVITQAFALLATMSALVLGLLIASAKASYDTRGQEVLKLATDIIALDWVLRHYGPETAEARSVLSQAATAGAERMWPSGDQQPALPAALTTGASPGAALYGKIEDLSPHTEAQKALQARALQMAFELGVTRIIQLEQIRSSIPIPFLLVLVFWVCLLFVGFGLFAPVNTTVISVFLVSALSVSGALFLIVELDRSFEGVIQVSSTPVRAALVQLSR
jgi:hypothetical protein